MRRLSVSLLLTAFAVVALAPASHADEQVPPADVTIGELLAGVDIPQEAELSAMQLRLTAMETLFAIDPSTLGTKDVTRANEALAAFARTADWFANDRIVDERLFDADEDAARLLGGVSGADEAIDSALATVVASSRLAVLGDMYTFQTLAEHAGRSIDQEVHRFQQKVDQADSHVDKRQWKQAIESLHQAWRIIDGAAASLIADQDPDHDGLMAWQEEELGTSSDLMDSDGDGLADLTELIDTFTDPAASETEPGVKDGAGDRDGDGLTDAEEVSHGTLVIEADTDGDGLTDGFEVNDFGSDPNLIDTDSDGLTDDSEFRLGTDPRVVDTDGDGVGDAEETYVSHLSEGDYRLAIEGVGDVAATVVVTDETSGPLFDGVEAVASRAIDFSTTAAFSQATVAFTPEEGPMPGRDPSDFAIGFYDESTGVLTPLETTFDPATGEFSAVTTHFTTFVLFYVPTWQTVLDTFVPGSGVGGTVGLDAAFVLDSSGSMSSNDPQGYRRTAAKSFVDALIDGDRVSVVDFDSSAKVYYALGTDFDAAKSAIDRVNSSGGTNIGAGVNAGLNQLLGGSERDDRAQVLILLTDGQGSYSSSYTTLAADNGIQIFTVGLGSGVNASLLGSIANGTDGQYFPVASAEDLPQVFSRILDDLGDADTDGDGLLDRWELQGMPTGSGKLIYSDPTKADSDGDGLLDGEEVVKSSTPWLAGYFWAKSMPTSVDSDGDGLGDAEETDLGLPPMRFDYDGDGLGDGREYEMGYDPSRRNADGDRFDDSEELDGDTDPFTYDVTVGDRIRSFAAGAVLGELGYWIADKDLAFQVKLAYNPIPVLGSPVQLVIPIDGFIDLCDFMECVNLTDFRPIYVDQVEYVVGLIVLGFIPFVDIAVGIRDIIGEALQGQWGWAAFELGAGALGFFIPLAGDIPNVAKDGIKWINRSAALIKRQKVFIKAMARIDELADRHVVQLLWIVDPASAWKLRSKASSLKAEDLRWILRTGRQSASELANAVSHAQDVRRVTTSFVTKSGDGWFDSRAALTAYGRRGAEAEDFVRQATAGVAAKRTTNAGKARFIDSLATVNGKLTAVEVKTGDAKLTAFIQRQIDKDVALLREGKIDAIEWRFFPSRGGGRTGPDEALVAALESAGIPYIVWVP